MFSFKIFILPPLGLCRPSTPPAVVKYVDAQFERYVLVSPTTVQGSVRETATTLRLG